MTPDAALYEFFSSFGIPAYQDTSVPNAPELPYLTYTNTSGIFGDGPTNTTVNIWYYTESEAKPNAKARELREALKDGGVNLTCEGGSIWLLPGEPWCQAMNDPENPNVKRRYINIMREDFIV